MHIGDPKAIRMIQLADAAIDAAQKEKSSAATAGQTWLVEDCELTIANFRAIREQAASGLLPPSRGAGLGITRALVEFGVSKELYAAGQALENYYQDEYGA
jgi:hypothetical protein